MALQVDTRRHTVLLLTQDFQGNSIPLLHCKGTRTNDRWLIEKLLTASSFTSVSHDIPGLHHHDYTKQSSSKLTAWYCQTVKSYKSGTSDWIENDIRILLYINKELWCCQTEFDQYRIASTPNPLWSGLQATDYIYTLILKVITK